MITGDLRSKIDRIWDDFWSGGISNPLTVIEQITYLLFIKRLDEIHTNRELTANINKTSIENPVFPQDRPFLRWSRFKDMEARDLTFPLGSHWTQKILMDYYLTIISASSILGSWLQDDFPKKKKTWQVIMLKETVYPAIFKDRIMFVSSLLPAGY